MDDHIIFFRGVSSRQKSINVSIEKNPWEKGIFNAKHAKYGMRAATTGVKKR